MKRCFVSASTGYTLTNGNMKGSYVMESLNELEPFLAEEIKSKFSIIKLAGDASDRSYYRIVTDKKNYVLCADKNIKSVNPKDSPYLIVYNIFRSYNIDIPLIYNLDYERGFILMEDLGRCHLVDFCGDLNGNEIIEVYKKVIDLLVGIQSIPEQEGTPFNRAFDAAKLNYEFDFFIEHTLIGYYKLNGDMDEIAELQEEFYSISEILFKPEFFVLNHRDYHSKNVLIFNNRPYIIDFQDARTGLPQYDPASLIRDPYFKLEDPLFKFLKEYYYSKARDVGIHSMKRDEFDFYFDVMAFQRNIKAAGSFGYLAVCKKLPRYKEFIIPALSYLGDYADRQSGLQKAFRILKKIIPGEPDFG